MIKGSGSKPSLMPTFGTDRWCACRASQHRCAFECQSCGVEVRKPADDHVVSLLVSGGVPAQVWELPGEALEDKGGPVLSYDDLLDFALQLGETDLLAALAGAAVS